MRAYVLFAGLSLTAAALLGAGCRTPSRGSARTVEGVVEDVRDDDGTVTVRSGDRQRDILVMPETQIRIDDFKGTFSDIKEGQRVRASFSTEAGQSEGVRIDILDKGITGAGTEPGEERPPVPAGDAASHGP
jgi:hypothetical protein